MNSSDSGRVFRFAALGVVKHDYLPNGMANHPRFQPVVVADDPALPDWVHERNQIFADDYQIPYIKDVERALREYDVQVAVVSSEAERHCDLTVRAANAGLHVVQDKPMSNRLSECDRVVEAVERNNVRFLLWNRNMLPAVLHAQEMIKSGSIGRPHAIHVDFYFAKDAGPAKGTRGEDEPPMNWLDQQLAAHANGSDGGVGKEALGELQVEGIYPLAYVWMLMGANVERVFARTASHFHQVHQDNGVDDLATVTLEMEGGKIGSLCLGRIGAASHPDIGEIKIHVLGEKGGLVLSEARPETAVYYRNQSPDEFRHRRIANENDYLLAESFAQAIDTKQPSVLDARAGRSICATVTAAIESGRSGRPVTVNQLG